MNSGSKQYYRIIKPYSSNNVYPASTIISGAGKCFKEVLRIAPQAEVFSIMDINSQNIYDFNVNKPPVSKEVLDANPLVNLADIKKINDRIDSLEKRFSELESGKVKTPSLSEEAIILGGDNKSHISQNKSLMPKVYEANTLQQVKDMKVQNNKQLFNQLNNNVNNINNVDIARKFIN